MDGGLALTEIMYNPAEPASGTGTADDFEFIELKNITAAPDPAWRHAVDREHHARDGLRHLVHFRPAVAATGRVYLVVAKKSGRVSEQVRSGDQRRRAVYRRAGQRRRAVGDARRASRHNLRFRVDDAWKPSTDGDGKSLVLLDELASEAEYSEAGSWDASVAQWLARPNEKGMVINEVLSHTDLAIGDWIELHNNSTAAIDIGGWYLSDDENTPNKFRIPIGTVVPAGGYITFTQAAQFDNPSFPGALVPFGLSELGEEVVLTQADAAGNLGAYQVVTSFGAFDREVTFGRHVMSTGETAFPALASSTFGGANSTPRVERW